MKSRRNDQFGTMKDLLCSFLSKVKSHAAFWRWTRETLIPGLFADESQQQQQQQPSLYIIDGTNIRVGPLRLRQLRVMDGEGFVKWMSMNGCLL